MMVEKTVTTKSELCELIGLVLKADDTLTKEELIVGESIQEVFDNVMKSIHFRQNENTSLQEVYTTYEAQFKTFKYETLMRWVQNDINGLITKEERGNYDIGMAIMNLDIYAVVKNNDDFISFVQDLEKRINRVGFFLEPSKESKFNKLLVNLSKKELTEWESKFVKSLYRLKWSKLSDKQKETFNKVATKYGY